VDARREPEIVTGIEKSVAGTKRFVLSIRDLGAFPNARRPRVIWVGCEAVSPLELLQHRVEREMNELGFALEKRPFRPHLTLGRVKRDARSGDFRGIEGLLGKLAVQEQVEVVSVDLMQSELSRTGAVYSVRSAVPLEAWWAGV
jgi:2'-5' RNA ligase